MSTASPADPRAAARYSLGYAAKLVQVPVSTLRAWVTVREKSPKGAGQNAPALIRQMPRGGLSFMNVVELYTLAAMRRTYHLKLKTIRGALAFVEQRLGVAHPLAQQAFMTDGLDLFVEHGGGLLNVSEHGQVVIRETLGARLQLLEYDDGLAQRLFPFARTPKARAGVSQAPPASAVV